MTSPDIAVVGGGLVGAAIAWGLARTGVRVALLDEGDVALRASRGNFGLVWVQSKGLGMPDYAAWTKHSSDNWAEMAGLLHQAVGIDVAFRRPGGITLSLSEAELAARADELKRLHNQPDMVRYSYEVLDRAAVAALVPSIGPQVVGGTWCPLDGHANPLLLLRALHIALEQAGGRYLPNHAVTTLRAEGTGFALDTAGGRINAGKVVLAAGLANARLAPMVGLAAPVRPVRGQIIVTERVQPFLALPMVNVRQTAEGSVMIGDSAEEAGFDETASTGVTGTMAARAIRFFPALEHARVVRTWAALRVMSPDGFPIYQQSPRYPGAYLATCHSGVTLAASHALALAPAIAADTMPDRFRPFSASRFDVSPAA